MGKKIIIAGGSGFIGTKLAAVAAQRNYEPAVISRDIGRAGSFPYRIIGWERESLEKELSGAFAVVNLAGVPIDGRWTAGYKEKILKSRTESTSKLVSAINSAANPPEVMFNISAVGYYGIAGDGDVDEAHGPGNDFLSSVCSAWEAEAVNVRRETRLVIGRTGIVLDSGGGALKKLLTTFRSYVGGSVGSGKQWMSWIHSDDLTSMILWVLENPVVSGPINCTAPNPVRMEEFARTLGRVMNKPSFFRVPAFAVKALMGEAATIVLDGSRVIPAAALQLGYNFRYEHLEEALRDLLKEK